MWMVSNLFKGDICLYRINYCTITLIPKKKHSERIGDFRPIALLNNTLKIVAKTLAN